MRKWLVAVLFAAALGNGGSVVTAQQQHPLKTLDEAWLTAAKAGNVDAMTALYAPDAVLYPPGALELRGLDAIRKEWAAMLAAYTITDGKMDAVYETSGNVSVGWGRFTLTVVPKAGGAPMKWEGRMSAVAKPIKGKWLYVSDHASMPMPPPPAKS